MTFSNFSFFLTRTFLFFSASLDHRKILFELKASEQSKTFHSAIAHFKRFRRDASWQTARGPITSSAVISLADRPSAKKSTQLQPGNRTADENQCAF